MGCHFLLQGEGIVLECKKGKAGRRSGGEAGLTSLNKNGNLLKVLVPRPSRLFCPWDFPGKNTGVGCHFLIQGIFLDQGSNPRFYALAGRWILHH